jgi:hypothetical protein
VDSLPNRAAWLHPRPANWARCRCWLYEFMGSRFPDKRVNCAPAPLTRRNKEGLEWIKARSWDGAASGFRTPASDWTAAL